MKILFDASGGDNAPLAIIQGALDAREEFKIDATLIGDEENIKKVALDNNINLDFDIIDAKEVIENTDDPAKSIRRKKDSSIVKGLNLLKENEYDAFISCGSTGALLAGGIFIVGRIENVKRAVLPTFLPAKDGKVLLIDSGANMDCDEELLLQFAKLGSSYLESLGNENPRVGLLNVGSEEGKGNAVTKKAYQLLKESDLNFVGNIEARDITSGNCDLVVCDGFDGNVILKNTEGIAMFLLKTIQKTGLEIGIDQVQLKQLLGNTMKSLDYKEVGGVSLLGLKNIIIKAHGSSDAKAIKNAVKSAIFTKEHKTIEIISDKFKEEK
ncbi:phosphate acyltransferase PlsX [Peptoniphilus obesi]|uniref:phosphate acyltransferase PlsX n=1 Tax=Peptoniphilus obesi TaxID=1472765 RepID=UPI0004B101C2|nr:phosphate acyltransferase PlsX [Peptoniphilus obesi]